MGLCRYSVNYRFWSKTNDSYVYDERRLSYFGRMQYDYKGNIYCQQC
jgi:hypothetical protein